MCHGPLQFLTGMPPLLHPLLHDRRLTISALVLMLSRGEMGYHVTTKTGPSHSARAFFVETLTSLKHQNKLHGSVLCTIKIRACPCLPCRQNSGSCPILKFSDSNSNPGLISCNKPPASCILHGKYTGSHCRYYVCACAQPAFLAGQLPPRLPRCS